MEFTLCYWFWSRITTVISLPFLFFVFIPVTISADFSLWFWLFHSIIALFRVHYPRDDYHVIYLTCLFTTYLCACAAGAGWAAGAGLERLASATAFWAATSACCFSILAFFFALFARRYSLQLFLRCCSHLTWILCIFALLSLSRCTRF